MYNWDSSWNWSTKSLSSPSLLVLFPQHFHFLITVLCACSYLCLKTLTEVFLNFLSSISSVCLFSSCVILCLRFCTLCLSLFHHDDYACILLCLLLSTYSAASSSSLGISSLANSSVKNFIKIAYSPPSSRYNALSVHNRSGVPPPGASVATENQSRPVLAPCRRGESLSSGHLHDPGGHHDEEGVVHPWG